MPRLEDLKTNLLNMSEEELRAKIKEIREDRIIRKGLNAKPAKAKKVKEPKPDNLRAALDAMSPEALAALMKGLE